MLVAVLGVLSLQACGEPVPLEAYLAIGPGCMVCQDGEQRCSHDMTTLEMCSGGSWADHMHCAAEDKSCEVSEAGAPVCVPVTACTNGARRCHLDEVQRCEDGAWETSADCEPAGSSCVWMGGAPTCAPCEDQETRCSHDRLETCMDGTWTETSDCAAEGMYCGERAPESSEDDVGATGHDAHAGH